MSDLYLHLCIPTQGQVPTVWNRRKKIFIIHGKGRIGGEGEEGGGDLDTIVSNTFYGVWCRGMVCQEEQRDAVYGQDFAFDYVNYHEGLSHLSVHHGCDIYLPDFPLDAIPDIRRDVLYLAEHDVRLIRIDDHHPYTPAAIANLQSLVDDGLLTTFAIQAPRKGEEVPKTEQVCGADLIYRTFVHNQPWDNPGLAELRRLAHVQDLHTEMSPLAIDLSKLIGSGHSKIDMVFRLMDIKSRTDMDDILRNTGWDREVKAYDKGIARVVSKLNNNLVLIELYRPLPDGVVPERLFTDPVALKPFVGFLRLLLPIMALIPERSTWRRRFGEWLYGRNSRNILRIAVALAPWRAEGEVRINVAAAIEYLKTRVSMDYFFYCYGSFLMTTRNVDDKQRLLDLSLFLPYIGSPSDGGHKEAASGKPSENPSFDRERFERVFSNNFLEYVQYVAEKVATFTSLRLKGVRKVGD